MPDKGAKPPSLPPLDCDAATAYAHLVDMQRSHDLYLQAKAKESYSSVVDATAQIWTGKLLMETFQRIDKQSRTATYVATGAAVAAVIVAGADLIATLVHG